MSGLDARAYAVDELLRDGGSIHIRAIRADDKERLAEAFGRLSPRSIYFRFFSPKLQLSDAELRYFTELDFVGRVGLVATLLEDGRERIVAVGRYFALGDEAPHRAEAAFTVIDAHQGRGIGTLLLEHLAVIARRQGLTEFEADVLGENNAMMEVFAQSGLKVKRALAQGVFHLSLSTEETPELAAATLQRARAAAAESLHALLRPGAVALVGASRHAGTIGAILLDNLRGAGFTGALYPVNPHASEIAGLKVYPSVAAIGAPVDLAVIAVPAAAVRAAVEDCARARVRALVVISAGFAESSAPGKEAEAGLRDFVRASGMRMVGPNCLGVLNTDPAVRLNATFAPVAPVEGNVGLLSQSGALGLVALDDPRGRHLGLSSFVSVGNRADVSCNDLLCYWADDPRTAVIALYLESFGNPRTFARIAPSVARRKPIVAVKAGRSGAGSRAAASHSAALASRDAGAAALFEQAGVIRTDTLEQLFDATSLLATQPVPGGSRVGIVTNAGGPAILFADAGEARGLTFPEPAPATIAALRALLPAHASVRNPVDLLASASPEQYAQAIACLGSDPNVDAVVVMHVPVLAGDPRVVGRAIADGAAGIPPEKPILAVFLSARGAPEELHAGARGRIPTYPYPENAAIALAAAARYGRWRAEPVGAATCLTPFARDAVRAVVDRALARAGGPCWLEPTDLTVVLRAAGLEVAAAEEVAPEDAPAAAERLGYPLVVKAVAPGLIHKSDVGGVILGVASAADVRSAIAALESRMRAIGITLERVLLQRQVAGNVEALVGVASDPTFGPLVVCALGGVLVEVLHDVTFRLPPVTDVEAERMIDGLHASALLAGYRGTPPADRAALAAIITRVSALVDAAPEICELDLNPIEILAPGKGAIVVDARLRVAPLGPSVRPS